MGDLTDIEVDDRLMALLGQIHGAAIEFDQDGRYLNVFTRDPNATPAPREMLLGKTIPDIYGHEEGAPLVARIRRVFETGIAEQYEHKLRMRGTMRWFAADLKRVRRGDRFTVVVFRVDITDRKNAEDALRTSEERFRLAADATNDLLYDADLVSGRCTWGPSITRVFGHPIDLSVEAWMACVHPDDLARLRVQLGRVLADPRTTSWLFSYHVRRGDGSYADVLDRATLVRDDAGKALRLVGSLADVTQLNRLQMQLVQADRLAALGMLAAGVGHEINNPLCFVLGNLDLALAAPSLARDDDERAAEHEIREAIGEARDGALRIFEIVKSLRLFARNDPTINESVKLADVVERALKISENEVRHRARLVRAFGDVPPVRVNESQLGQVCLNLVVNAAQAIPLGSSDRNEITIRTGVDDRGRAFIAVRDTGSGIAPEHIDRIFDPFFTTKPVGVGTGIGLSVCMSIVQSMGGELSVTSEPGKTEFTVALPMAA